MLPDVLNQLWRTLRHRPSLVARRFDRLASIGLPFTNTFHRSRLVVVQVPAGFRVSSSGAAGRKLLVIRIDTK
jgi:hypothetical protein